MEKITVVEVEDNYVEMLVGKWKVGFCLNRKGRILLLFKSCEERECGFIPKNSYSKACQQAAAILREKSQRKKLLQAKDTKPMLNFS